MNVELLIRLRALLVEEHERVLGLDMRMGRIRHGPVTTCTCQVAQDYRTVKALAFSAPAHLPKQE